MIDLNFTGVEAPKFEPIPDGEYRMKLVGLEIKPTKDKANIGANCTYEVTEQSDGGSEYLGKKVFNWQTIQGPSVNMGFVKLWLEALTGEELTSDFTLDPDQLVGLEVTGFVGTKEYNGNDSNYIKYWINPNA